MHLEKRGKYPGVKIHLNDKETTTLLDLNKECPPGFMISFTPDTKPIKRALKLLAELATMITALLKEEPAVLAERTPEEIRQTLIEERDQAIKKLAKLEAGGLWNDGKSKA